MKCLLCGIDMIDKGVPAMSNGAIVVVVVPVWHDDENDYVYAKAVADMEKELADQGFSQVEVHEDLT